MTQMDADLRVQSCWYVLLLEGASKNINTPEKNHEQHLYYAKNR